MKKKRESEWERDRRKDRKVPYFLWLSIQFFFLQLLPVYPYKIGRGVERRMKELNAGLCNICVMYKTETWGNVSWYKLRIKLM